jgi:hypothetical protein
MGEEIPTCPALGPSDGESSARLEPPQLIITPRFFIGTSAGSPANSPAEPTQELRRSVEGGIQALMNEAEAISGREDLVDALVESHAPDSQLPTIVSNPHFLITEVSGAIPETLQKKAPAAVLPSLDLSPQPESEAEVEVEIEPCAEPEPSPTYSDTELQDAFAGFQQNRTIPPPGMKLILTQFVHYLIGQAIEAEEYDLAEQIENDLRELTTAYQQSDMENASHLQSQSLESRLEEVKQKQLAIEAEWEQKMARLRAKQEQKMLILEQRQQEERELFEQKCQTPDFLQRFTKPSSQLLALWRLQKSLAFQHEFDAAKDAKARAEELQRRETMDAQSRAMKSVRQNYEQLLQRQKREIECAKANDIRKLKALEIEMKKEKEAVEKLNKQVETRIKDQRPPLKRSGLPPLQAAQRDGSSQLLRRAGRPRSGLNEQGGAQLDVKITNIKAVLGGKSK